MDTALLKRLAGIALVILLYVQLASPPDKIATVSGEAAAISDCAYRFAQSIGTSYVFRRLTVREGKAFLVEGKSPSDPTRPPRSRLELRFIAQGETTRVELRDAANGDHEMEEAVWSIIEHCARQAKPTETISSIP